MAVVSGNSEFLDYTKEWISIVNRGGFFLLNDATVILLEYAEYISMPKRSRSTGRYHHNIDTRER